jgi:hypothetical protein
MDFSVIEGPAGEIILLEYIEPDRIGETGKSRKKGPALPLPHLPRLSRIAFQLSSCSLYFSASFE